ncbi:MAG: hypothetical protein HC896_09880 [Bacteroidales bacterium]|nr:hypothetical protein [Bacteroidales bacterium]
MKIPGTDRFTKDTMEGQKHFAALSFCLPGMPLIYGGQETGLSHRLAFFEKDEIIWTDNHEMATFYKELIRLKKNIQAFWNGYYGGDIEWINTSHDEHIFAFMRNSFSSKAFCLFNLSAHLQEFNIKGVDHAGSYVEYFYDFNMNFRGHDNLIFAPWEYRVYIANS